MNYHKLTILTLTVLLGCFTCHAQSLKDDLIRIDGALEMTEDFNASHSTRVESIQKRLQNSSLSLKDQYNLYDELYNAEFSYKFDLANDALTKKISIAERLGDKGKILESAIDKAYLLCVAGMYLESEQAASEIDTTALSHDALIDYYYYRQRFHFDYQDNSNGSGVEDTRGKVNFYRNRIIEETPDNSLVNMYIRTRELIDTYEFHKADSLSNIYLSAVDKSSHEYAEMSYYKAVICQNIQDYDEMMHWYANSAIADIRSNTKDNASLQCMAVELLNRGIEIERAFRYTQYSLNDAVFYNAKLRPWQIAMSLPAIENAYNEERAAHERRNILLMSLIIALAVATALVSIKVYSLYKRQKKDKMEIEEMNRQINAALQELSMANAAKEEYIGLFLSMCSKYIDKLRKFMSMKEIDAELESFYKTFDNAFLQLYPDFVEKFNNLLKPEARIELKKDELLNTELRIFALIKLGITQSSHIATLLRYSVNTIYNYRAQIKNAALDGKEEFEDKIKNI
ncbi:MAG: DUF6377 domain-containing protein [Bacteroidales bacterium]|nr:DUF6377 domain-containing protein [Bacteroidales bacterium]